MSQSTEFRDQPLPHAEPPGVVGALDRVWSGAKLIVVRSVFWAYERGSWQYDLIVLAILAFVLLTPRTWFNDRPTLQMTDLRHQQGVVEMSRGKDGWRYLVDARLVESLKPLEADDAIQEILSSRLQTPFTIKSIVPVKDKNNVTLGYTVLIAH
jgi:hypothetical protein